LLPISHKILESKLGSHRISSAQRYEYDAYDERKRQTSGWQTDPLDSTGLLFL